jgi:hypothetical protein
LEEVDLAQLRRKLGFRLMLKIAGITIVVAFIAALFVRELGGLVTRVVWI